MSDIESGLADEVKLDFLAGKPVAVTSNRGHGQVPVRPGANPQLEQQYYQRKHTQAQSGEIFIGAADIWLLHQHFWVDGKINHQIR